MGSQSEEGDSDENSRQNFSRSNLTGNSSFSLTLATGRSFKPALNLIAWKLSAIDADVLDASDSEVVTGLRSRASSNARSLSLPSSWAFGTSCPWRQDAFSRRACLGPDLRAFQELTLWPSFWPETFLLRLK